MTCDGGWHARLGATASGLSANVATPAPIPNATVPIIAVRMSMAHRGSVDAVATLRISAPSQCDRRHTVAKYKLHCFGASGNAYKVALYLNCAGLDWEAAEVDFFNGQTRDAAWRASVNAMGEAPVLEADGKKLTQSGAILTWLSETTGRFAPSSPDQRI